MPSSLNLSLPEAPRPRQRGRWVQWLTLLAVLAVLALLIRNRKPAAVRPQGGNALKAEGLESLAKSLEKRTFYVQADEVWGEYLKAAPDLPAEKRAEILYRRGKCLKEAGKYAEAARWLTEIETLPLSSTRKRNAGRLLVECASALGKKGVEEMLSRKFATQSKEPEQGTVLARVGDSIAITREELRERGIRSMRQMLVLEGAALTPEELEKKADNLVDARLADPEGLQQALQQAVSQSLLYLEGLARGFGDDEKTLKDVARVREEIISRRVLEEELERAMKNLGPTEVANHYAAHKDRFVEKAGTRFSHARFDTEKEAREAIAKLRAGDAAAEALLKTEKEFAVEGEPVPGIGPSAEITAHLAALDKGEVGDRPIEYGGAYYVFRAEEKRPERQLSLEEAKSRVKVDLARIKRDEASKSLSELLQKKYKVEIVKPPEKGAAGPSGPGVEKASGTQPPPSRAAQQPPAAAGQPPDAGAKPTASKEKGSTAAKS